MIGTTGLTGAAPIWKQIMVQALANQGTAAAGDVIEAFVTERVAAEAIA